MANNRAYGATVEREKSADAREIGSPGEIVDRERRERCKADLSVFLKTYFPWAFPIPWCRDHLRIIDRLQTSIIEGGLFALAMPRGTGKTTICIRSALYAVLYGYREFVSVLGANEPMAKQLIKTMQDELRFNDLLAEDFPEVCHSIRALEGEPRRCKGQTIDGERTNTIWSGNQIVLPSIPEKYESYSRGAVVSVAGITGAVRGQQVTRADGKVLRPSFVIIDDPQTRDSARSESQCRTREAIVSGDVLGMAGPGVKVAAVMPCTVIRRGDMADCLLDRKTHPDWNGERTKMVYSFPSNEKLWDEYRLLRAEGMANSDGGKGATEFYRKNQSAMDEGSEVAWPERFNHDEISAIQHAMNLRYRDENAFLAEYQNEPAEERKSDYVLLAADQICSRVNMRERGIVPKPVTRLTAMIDVHKRLLYYAVVGWEDDFTGYVVDYGSWPDQGRNYWTMNGASKTIDSVLPGLSLDEQVYQSCQTLIHGICGREWPRENGGAMRIDKCLIDANWGPQTDSVYRAVRQSAHVASVLPSHGKYIGATSKPMSEYQKRDGERAGMHWRTGQAEKRSVTSVSIDVNWWKSFLHNRLCVPMGGKTGLSLYGNRPQLHQILADHLLAEDCIPVEAKGRTVNEWKVRPDREDNHLFDCLVGCAVGASIAGCTVGNPSLDPAKKKVSFAAMQAAKRNAKP